jgi:NAD-dependent deacetylase
MEIGDSDLGVRPSVSNTLACVISLIVRSAGRTTVITGAGISSHQLPTFRSNNNSGLWEAMSAPLFDLRNFSKNPGPPWKLIANIRNLQVTGMLYPSLAHHVLHLLLRRNFISHIITQNIDGLHNFASDVGRIVELHGAVSRYGVCTECSRSFDVDHLEILRTCEAPRCPGCASVLKPPVAFFGDAIAVSKRTAATAALAECELLILIGTHCTVDPVLSFAVTCKREGAVVVEINISPTTASSFVDVSLRGKADALLLEIGQELMPDIHWGTLKLDDWEPALSENVS